jgi:hypothetical protein
MLFHLSVTLTACYVFMRKKFCNLSATIQNLVAVASCFSVRLDERHEFLQLWKVGNKLSHYWEFFVQPMQVAYSCRSLSGVRLFCMEKIAVTVHIHTLWDLPQKMLLIVTRLMTFSFLLLKSISLYVAHVGHA